MDIDITRFILNEEPGRYSASAVELGKPAVSITWKNAVRYAQNKPLLTTPEQLNALRHWAKASGGWTKEETVNWSPDECNALFIQLISGDMREAGMDGLDIDDFDWSEYYARASAGQISGRISVCDIPDHESFGQFFYNLGD